LKSLPILERQSCFQPDTLLRRVADTLFPTPTFQAPDPETKERALKCCAGKPRILREFFTEHGWRPFSWAILISGFITGVFAGFLRGMFGVGGPPIMVYVTIAALDKETTRGLNNGIGVFITPILAGFMLIGQGGWKNSHWLAYLGVVVGGGLGTFVGNKLYPYVDSTTVLRIIILLLVLASVVMFSPPFWVRWFFFFELGV